MKHTYFFYLCIKRLIIILYYKAFHGGLTMYSERLYQGKVLNLTKSEDVVCGRVDYMSTGRWRVREISEV